MNIFVKIAITSLLGVLMFATISGASAPQKSLDIADAKVASLLATIRSKNYDATQEETNEELIAFLTEVCEEPASFAFPFKAASKEGLSLVSSPDNKMRIYSWDGGGGTLRFFTSLAQYKVSGDRKIKLLILHPKHHPMRCEKDIDAGWNYDKIRIVKTAHGGPIYLASGYGQYSTFGRGLSVEAYYIRDDSLSSAPVFKKGETLASNISASLIGGFGSIEFSENLRTIEIPESDKDCMRTGRVLSYKFDGEIFKFDGARFEASTDN